jgi:hypothetical protein
MDPTMLNDLSSRFEIYVPETGMKSIPGYVSDVPGFVKLVPDRTEEPSY